MTKVINSLQTNENQDKKDILVPVPDYVIVFGVEAIIAMMANYASYSDEEEKQNHIHSAINLLSCLSPHLSDLSNL